MIHDAGCRALHLINTNFCDDFALLSKPGCSASGGNSIELLLMLLGWDYAREGKKATQFSEVRKALRVGFDFSRSEQRLLTIRNTEQRRTNRTLACVSRTRRARSPQKVARTPDKSRSRLHFARSTRAISAEGCAHTGQIALSPAFRSLDTHDLRRGLHAARTNRTIACISRAPHARSPQRVARGPDKSHSRLHFAHSTHTISAVCCIFG